MDILKTNKKVLAWFCVYPASENASKLEKTCYILLTSTIVVFLIAIIIASALFFMQFILTDVNASLYAVYQCSIYGSGLCAIIFAIITRQQIIDMLENLSKIYEQSKNKLQNRGTNYYTNTFFEQVQRIEEFWQKERGICDNDCRLLVQSQMQTRIRSACWKKWEMNANGCGRSIFGQCFYQSVVHWICPPLRSALFGWKLALLILIFTIARIK